jgi:hypothetical protein
MKSHLRLYGATAVLLTAAITTLNASVAKAANFNFTYAPGTTQEQIAGVELAGLIWSQYLTDNVTVNLHFGMTTGTLDWGTLGGATPNVRNNFSYSQISSAMIAEDPNTVLPGGQSGSYKVLQQSGSINSNQSNVMMTRANAEALGMNVSSNTDLDGYVQLNANYNWSYNYALGTVRRNHFDFVSVVLHEIGHNLGFLSGIDPSNSKTAPTALDMFRYSDVSAVQGAIDFSIGSQERYFSLDGGKSVVTDAVTTTTVMKNGSIKTSTQTYEALFARGENTKLGGDGMQASHWADTNPNIGIMNPLVETNTIRTISRLDLKAMDAIGWDVNYTNYTNGLNLSSLWLLAQDKAKYAVIKDRSTEIQDLMAESGVYEFGWGGWWQQDAASTSAQSVPEPTAMLGLLSTVLLGLKSLRKGKPQK